VAITTGLVEFDAPFRFDSSGQPVVVAQGSPEDIGAQVYNTVVCPEGAKLGDPKFGVPLVLFGQAPLNTAPLLNGIRRVVPDADLSIAAVADRFDAAVQNVTILARATGSPVTTSSNP